MRHTTPRYSQHATKGSAVTSNVGIIIGTTREARFADHPAQWIRELISERASFAAETIDLRVYPMPLFSEPQAPAARAPADEVATRWRTRVAELDAYIFVTGEYNRSIPAVLKNALDHAYYEFNRKPAAFVSYGGNGGVRAIEHLRLICIELQMACTRNAVHIGVEPYAAVRDQGRSLSDFPSLNRAAATMLDELGWWAQTLKTGRGS